MVSMTTVIAVIITLCISTLLPIGVFVIYGVKNKGKGIWSAWFLGAAGFFVMQVVIRTPIISLLALKPGFKDFVTGHYVIYCFILAITAALFEVVGRYVVAKIMKKNLTFERGIAAGLGHGGIESIVIIGLSYISNLIYIVMINAGSFDVMVEQMGALGADTSGLISLQDTLLHTNSVIFLLAGYERILTMIFHVALSLLVCYYVSRKEDVKGIVICTLLHGVVDFTAPFVNGYATEYMGNVISTTTAHVILYIFLTVVAVGSVLIIKKISSRFKQV